MIQLHTDHCSTCPVDPGLNCYRDSGMCARAARPGEDGFRAMLIRHSLIRAKKAFSTERPSCKESLAMISQVKACPSWVSRSDCGCGINQCLAGKGDGGYVNHQDCFECLEADCGQ